MEIPVGRLSSRSNFISAVMLASMTVAIAMLLLQSKILKPLFDWPASEYSASHQSKLPDDEDNSLALLNIEERGSAVIIACHNNSAEDDYFNRSYFHLNNSVSYDISSDKTRAAGSCDRRHQLIFREFRKADAVRCLDALSVKRNRRPMHIAFIAGDSTVRQHFVSFIRWIPDYDRKISRNSTMYAEYYFHEDRNISSPLMDDLLVSFYWRRLIKEDLIADFKRWASTDDDNQVPDFILLGVTAHHIAENHILSKKMYEKLLENELMPLINKSLNAHPHQEIVWLQQSPTIQTFQSGSVYPELIAKYNKEIRRIFKSTRVVMWDSVNVVVEEYLRACALTKFERRDKEWYSKCNDFIHAGFGALFIGTQLIINHICSEAA